VIRGGLRPPIRSAVVPPVTGVNAALAAVAAQVLTRVTPIAVTPTSLTILGQARGPASALAVGPGSTCRPARCRIRAVVTGMTSGPVRILTRVVPGVACRVVPGLPRAAVLVLCRAAIPGRASLVAPGWTCATGLAAGVVPRLARAAAVAWTRVLTQDPAGPVTAG
jgi:hypothetical protein